MIDCFRYIDWLNKNKRCNCTTLQCLWKQGICASSLITSYLCWYWFYTLFNGFYCPIVSVEAFKGLAYVAKMFQVYINKQQYLFLEKINENCTENSCFLFYYSETQSISCCVVDPNSCSTNLSPVRLMGMRMGPEASKKRNDRPCLSALAALLLLMHFHWTAEKCENLSGH